VLAPSRVSEEFTNLIGRRWPGVSADWNDRAYHRVRALTQEVHYQSASRQVNLLLYTPNEVCRYRAETFATKEPETLEWIEQYGGEGAFYDVGANVGLYSMFYAKVHPGRVYAFEPSALNLGLLAANISINGLASRVVVVPTPLTERNEVAAFHLSMLDEGGSMSTFGQDYGHDGLTLNSCMDYETVGMSLDFLFTSGVLRDPPRLVKIDVDGIEHLILRGAQRLLGVPELKTILIEVNDDFAELADEVNTTLRKHGFVLEAKRHADMFESGPFGAIYNQIWIRK
jgi:FkbM family methyltransferase